MGAEELPFNLLVEYALEHGLTAAEVAALRPKGLTQQMVGLKVAEMDDKAPMKTTLIVVAAERLDAIEKAAMIRESVIGLGFAQADVRPNGKGRFRAAITE